MGEPGVDPLLEVCVFMLFWVQFTRATSHNVAVARYGVSHVEVVNSVCQQRAAQLSATFRLVSKPGEATVLDRVVAHKMRCILSETSADFIKRIVRQRAAKLFRESS